MLRLSSPPSPASGITASAIGERGADLSFEQQEEAAGARLTDNGVKASPLQILQAHGLNYVRLRLWVNPPPGYSNLASDLRMARRIKAAGDKLYLDIHYSDFWADPQHQDTPPGRRSRRLACSRARSRSVPGMTRRRCRARCRTAPAPHRGNSDSRVSSSRATVA